MKRHPAIRPATATASQWRVRLQPLERAFHDWTRSDGLLWLHLLKTVMAGLLALGIAMVLDLPQPRIAMTTVFVLMQPFSGMVLAKSFYRILGTLAGTAAALTIGALFVQQPELYLTAMIGWISACIAAAVRYRHMRWYGFVLAGYTAALIGIPNVMTPHDLFLAALTRAAEVAVGIGCSGAVSALIVPRRSSLALRRTLQNRYADFTAFAVDVLRQRIERNAFERRFASLVDDIVGFEATRMFAAFEEPGMRSRAQQLGRLNGEFMDACARLHAMNQLFKRMRKTHAETLPVALAPYLDDLVSLLTSTEAGHAKSFRILTARLRRYRAHLPGRTHETRRLHQPHATLPRDTQADFDTAIELIDRFVTGWIRYSETYASLAACPKTEANKPGFPPAPRRSPEPAAPGSYTPRTSPLTITFTFLRAVMTMAVTAWFWIDTGWPSGGLALIGAALACALTSTAPNPSKMAMQMGAGALMATATGYLYTCHIYPDIDGFPLLCLSLAPVLALGAFFATRKQSAGFGIGFSVFFCLLAGPDNVTVYAPDGLLNNGLALSVSMLLSALVSAVVFPVDMPWLVRRLMANLRAQVVSACQDDLRGLDRRFQSGTHDLTFQLRALLTRRSRRRRHALRWMLVTLEIGHAMIDLRHEARHAGYLTVLHPDWDSTFTSVRKEIAHLFRHPHKTTTAPALAAVHAATCIARDMLDHVATTGNERLRDLQRILSCLHFIRTALLDTEAPFRNRSRNTDANAHANALHTARNRQR